MRVLLATLNSKFIHSNLAIRYLYEASNDSRENITIREFTINNSEDYMFTELVAGNFHVVCFSCYIWNIQKTLHLCENLKKAQPNVRIVLGGPEVSYDAGEILKANPFVDFILIGEGEENFPKLIKNLETQIDNGIDIGLKEEVEAIDGIAYRKDNEIIVKPQLKLIDMEKIPYPYGSGYEKDKVIYYEGTRGCPYNCSYCMSSIDKKVRSIPLDRLKKEMKRFLDENVKQVKFLDRTFNWDKERSDEIFAFLIENDNGSTNFHFEICADNLTEKTFEILKHGRKGLFQFEIGIQSTNQQTLDSVNRSSDNVKLLDNVKKIINMKNIHTHVDLIAGLPFETYEIFGHSFDQVFGLRADALQLGFLKLLKGTKIRNEEKLHEYKYDEIAPYQVISNKYITAYEIAKLKMIENILDIYCNKGGYETSLEAIIKHYKRPFEFFEEFSAYYYKKGFQNRSHKKEDQYRILNNFVVDELKIPEITKDITKDLEVTMNFDAVKKFFRKGWQIND